MNGSTAERIHELCNQLTALPAFAGIEIVRCSVVKEHRVHSIRVTIDREGGVDSDLCEAVSRYLERRIDELPPPVPLFALEVSSAGVERPLLRPEHYRRFVGKEINVITTLRIKNRTEFTGAIESADDNAVTIADRFAGITPLPYAVIKRAHLVYDPRTDLNRKP